MSIPEVTAQATPFRFAGQRRPTSVRLAPRRPRPGEKKLIASSMLVLPAPFGPNRKALRAIDIDDGTLIRPKLGEGELKDAANA